MQCSERYGGGGACIAVKSQDKWQENVTEFHRTWGVITLLTFLLD